MHSVQTFVCVMLAYMCTTDRKKPREPDLAVSSSAETAVFIIHWLRCLVGAFEWTQFVVGCQRGGEKKCLQRPENGQTQMHWVRGRQTERQRWNVVDMQRYVPIADGGKEDVRRISEAGPRHGRHQVIRTVIASQLDWTQWLIVHNSRNWYHTLSPNTMQFLLYIVLYS